MGWDQKVEMTEQEKASFELEQLIEKSPVGQGTTIVVASCLFSLIKDVQNGKKLEDSFIKDFLKAAMMMHHYASEAGQIEFLMKNIKPEHTMQQFLTTLPAMRIQAGIRAVKWGDDLQRLFNLVDDHAGK